MEACEKLELLLCQVIGAAPERCPVTGTRGNGMKVRRQQELTKMIDWTEIAVISSHFCWRVFDRVQ